MTELQCYNRGCGKKYIAEENTPGKMKFNSIMTTKFNTELNFIFRIMPAPSRCTILS